jgi:hypothetical protein
MKVLNICLLLIISLSISCGRKEQKEIESDYLTSFLETIPIKDNTKWVIVLPGLGCHGCIQEAEIFMKDNVENKNILFVLTSIESLKILEGKIGIKVRDYKNVYIDKENKFNIGTDNAIYPCIVQLENSLIKEHQFQSPKNGQAFATLQSRITN